ncbi:type IX secretion system membrane protein PorP/SprF [Paraflavitalea pollutisoli]|uniref:PorP/SprF family type IX secretion system membrane protein n=1 Tax=Paraflavitalea pollutisoli TaxID=3034143 RepID=UPI0023EDA675|nr:type IX secretion system membrane protein PorP/SprF [Paraflavitalea sp. H1-2-19X]
MRIYPFYLALCMLAFCSVPADAQQLPHYTQYVLNNYILNPALAGIENYTDIRLSHRHQWSGLEGAPVTTYFTAHTPLKKDDYGRTTATGYAPSNESVLGDPYFRTYEAAPAHAGIGLTVLNDRTGPLNRFTAYGSFAYHVPLSTKLSLAMGISGGVSQLSLRQGDLDFGDATVDPAVTSKGTINKLKPEANAGLWLYGQDFFVGASVQQLVPSKISWADNNVVPMEGKLVPHTFVTAGYRFWLGDAFSLLPSVMVRYVSPMPLGVDVNAKLQYKQLVWVGAAYRHEEGFAGMAGLHVAKGIIAGYSYDYTISKLNTVSRGSHELMIGFILGNKYIDDSPRNVW